VSIDGGATFTPNVQISAGTSNGVAAGGFNFGDYDKMTFANGMFWRTWADNSNSTGDNPDGAGSFQDIYTAKVTVTVTAAAAVPEPTTLALFGVGLSSLVACSWRRR
jgi:hypothetical protein